MAATHRAALKPLLKQASGAAASVDQVSAGGPWWSRAAQFALASGTSDGVRVGGNGEVDVALKNSGVEAKLWLQAISPDKPQCAPS
jgi:hypothetical protein